MADPSSRSTLQALLMTAYARLGGDILRRSRLGRWAFESAYVSYKLRLEAGPIDQLRPLIRPGTWAIDVGANIGVLTLRFAQSVSAGGKVIALEPEGENFEALSRRVAAAGLDGVVVTRCAAAAEHSGIEHLKINPQHPGDHRLAADGVSVPSVTLDDLLAELGTPSVSLIKIDVQGAEMRVLKGAKALITRDRPALFVEIEDAALRRQNSSAEEVFAWLLERGYLAFQWRRSGRATPIESAGAVAPPAGYADVLFLPAGQASPS